MYNIKVEKVAWYDSHAVPKVDNWHPDALWVTQPAEGYSIPMSQAIAELREWSKWSVEEVNEWLEEDGFGDYKVIEEKRTWTIQFDEMEVANA